MKSPLSVFALSVITSLYGRIPVLGAVEAGAGVELVAGAGMGLFRFCASTLLKFKEANNDAKAIYHTRCRFLFILICNWVSGMQSTNV